MHEKHYTTEQLESLSKQGEQVGPERIKQVEAEWPRLMDQVRHEMDNGTDPTDPRVKALAERWMGLVREFTGGDPGITRSLRNLYRTENEVAGMDIKSMRPMMDFISKAMATG